MKTNVFCLVVIVFTTSVFAVRFDSNLTKMEENRAAIKAVLADPKATPAQKLWATYDDLKWDLFTCEDKDFPAKKAAMLKLICERGSLDKSVYLDFIYGLQRENPGAFRMPDLWEIVDRETKGDAKFRTNYYRRRLESMRGALRFRGTIDPDCTAEARLKLLDEAEKDPAVDQMGINYDASRFDCYVDLGDDARAEAMLKKMSASTNMGVRVEWLAKGAEWYKNRAVRYYAEPDAAMLRKVVACCDGILSTDFPRKRGNADAKAALMKADALCQVGDYAEARKALDKLASLSKDKKLGLDGAKILFDVAYAEKKWSEAADVLAPFADKIDADWSVKCAQALVAAGRRREALPYLETASKKCHNKYKRDNYGYLLNKYKAEFGETK